MKPVSTSKIHVREDPFPHSVTHGLWDSHLLRGVLDEFPVPADPRLKHFAGENERKMEGGPALFGPRTWELAELVGKLAPALSEKFSLPTLEMELVGGGYHMIAPGGYLNIHTDFTVSPDTGRYRRLNLLVYLNRGWAWTNGGFLELWDDTGPVAKIHPLFNTTAIFMTSSRSWHGHPDPVHMDAPYRKSFAAYFYSDEPPLDFTDQSTTWHPNAPKIGG